MSLITDKPQVEGNVFKARTVCAVVTSFFPDEEFPLRIKNLLDQAQCVVVVDDSGSVGEHHRLNQWFHGVEGVKVIHHPSNLGVAAALNTGIEKAAELGFGYALLLDDDSQLRAEFLTGLLAEFEKSYDPNRTIVGINFGKLSRKEDVASGDNFREVESLITAGCIVSINLHQTIGPFRTGFFIDYVDHDYCLRARAEGIRLVQYSALGLIQPIGQTQQTSLGELASVHSATRVYYFFRNSTIIVKEYYRKYPQFILWIIYQQLKTIAKILLFLHPKHSYIKAMFRGWLDSFSCSLGKMPDGRIY
ncbi:MAG: glycosyltransferase [Desulfuromonadales bacterium]